MDDALAKRTANISRAQLETLVSYMEKYPNLAVGKKENLMPEKRKAMWFDLYVQLNAVIGGTQKTLDQWKKTWNDQKAKTHAKAMKLIETGGNSTYLTPLEERILKILSLNNEFKSPQPSSDIFLIPETGIVFSLPIVSQDGSQPSVSQDENQPSVSPDGSQSSISPDGNQLSISQDGNQLSISQDGNQLSISQDGNQPSVSQDVSSTPSTSQDIPDISLISQEISDPVMSESSNISVTEVLPSADTHVLAKPETLTEAPVITLSSTDIPFLIKQETQEKRNVIAHTTQTVDECSAENAKSITCYDETTGSGNNPSANVTRPEYPAETARKTADCPSSTTSYNTPRATSGKGRKRQRSHLRSHYMTADKAAETFGYISERNCAVLERIASAMEAQANRAAKQTQLMREIVDVVKRK